jgi:ribonuclease I
MKDSSNLDTVLDLSTKIKQAEQAKKASKKELDEMFQEAFGDRKITIVLGNNKDIQSPLVR